MCPKNQGKLLLVFGSLSSSPCTNHLSQNNVELLNALKNDFEKIKHNIAEQNIRRALKCILRQAQNIKSNR